MKLVVYPPKPNAYGYSDAGSALFPPWRHKSYILAYDEGSTIAVSDIAEKGKYFNPSVS